VLKAGRARQNIREVSPCPILSLTLCVCMVWCGLVCADVGRAAHLTACLPCLLYSCHDALPTVGALVRVAGDRGLDGVPDADD